MNTIKPSGAPLRADAEALALESSGEDFFLQTPRAIATIDFARAMRLRSGEPSVYESFLGSIPPEETDEEFAAAVESLS